MCLIGEAFGEQGLIVNGAVVNIRLVTLPIAKILSVKNARAWVSMLSYLKNK